MYLGKQFHGMNQALRTTHPQHPVLSKVAEKLLNHPIVELPIALRRILSAIC